MSINRFQANEDGKISVNELDNVLAPSDMVFLSKSSPPFADQTTSDDLDTNEDGIINLSEFAAFCRSDTTDGGFSEFGDAFDLCDQDKNELTQIWFWKHRRTSSPDMTPHRHRYHRRGTSLGEERASLRDQRLMVRDVRTANRKDEAMAGAFLADLSVEALGGFHCQQIYETNQGE